MKLYPVQSISVAILTIRCFLNLNVSWFCSTPCPTYSFLGTVVHIWFTTIGPETKQYLQLLSIQNRQQCSFEKRIVSLVQYPAYFLATADIHSHMKTFQETFGPISGRWNDLKITLACLGWVKALGIPCQKKGKWRNFMLGNLSHSRTDAVLKLEWIHELMSVSLGRVPFCPAITHKKGRLFQHCSPKSGHFVFWLTFCGVRKLSETPEVPNSSHIHLLPSVLGTLFI